MKRSSVLLTILSLGLTGCSQNVKNTSQDGNPAKFYFNSINHRIIDPQNDKEEIILIIYSSFCGYCQEVEPIFEEILNKDYQNYNIVSAESYEIKDGYYSIGVDYRAAIDFYYTQDESYINDGFKDSNQLYTYSMFPTPTLIYLKKNKVISRMMIGGFLTHESIVEALKNMVL